MGKDVFIEAPCAHMELRANPISENQEKATIHFIAVPEEALKEVQEVLKKYGPQVAKFNALFKKAVQKK